MALVLDHPLDARSPLAHGRAAKEGRLRKAGAVGIALALHAAILGAVLLTRAPGPATDRPPIAVELVPPAPPPFVPPRATRQTHAGGSPAAAPRRARPSAPVSKPSLVPPQTIRPPAPVEMLPVPTPTLVAPRGPDLASPITGAGAGAATGGSGAGTGTGSGGPGGYAAIDPRWLSSPGPDEVGRAYPLDAYRDGRGGSVELGCLELTDGRVKACRVLSETPRGAGFGRAALKLSPLFRFLPTRIDGRAVETRIRIPYDFSVGD